MACLTIYSPEEKRIIIEAAVMLGPSKIAEERNIPASTIYTWLSDVENEDFIRILRKRKEAKLLHSLENVAQRLTDRMLEAPLEKEGIRDIAIATGITVEKARLITGQSTSNNAIVVQFSIPGLSNSPQPIDVTPIKSDDDK